MSSEYVIPEFNDQRKFYEGYNAYRKYHEELVKELEEATSVMASLQGCLVGISKGADDGGTRDRALGNILELCEDLMKVYKLDPNTMYPVYGNYYDENGGT